MTMNRTRPSRRQRAADRRGAVTVEFAICATVFFMFIFGMMELTRYIYVQHSVQMVAYEAARAGVVPGATRADVVARAEDLLAATGIHVYDPPQVEATNPDAAEAEINSLTEAVRVTIDCDFANNSWLPPTFLKGATISSTIELQHENMAYLQPGQTDLEELIGNNDNEPIDE